MVFEFNPTNIIAIAWAIVSLLLSSPLFILWLRRAGIAKDERQAKAIADAALRAVVLVESGQKGVLNSNAKLDNALTILSHKFPKLDHSVAVVQIELALMSLGEGLGKPKIINPGTATIIGSAATGGALTGNG